MKFKAFIPNLFTLGNLAMGCLAIVHFSDAGYRLLEYDPKASDYTVRFFSPQLVLGSYFIFAAALFDLLDGMVARLLRVESELGKQLDSLADLVSFGVAPSMAIYQMLQYSLASRFEMDVVPMWWLSPLLCFPLAAAYRLATFNLLSPQKKSEIPASFSGLPTPAAGLGLVSLVWAYIAITPIRQVFYHPLFIYGVVLLFSLLMILRVRMYKLEFGNLKKNPRQWLLLLLLAVGSLLGFSLVGYLCVWVSIILYVLYSLVLPPKKISH